MKMVISLGVALVFSMAASAGEKDVWYDAGGNVVKVTRAEPEKEQRVPIWKKREQQRLARMEEQRQRRYRSSRSRSTSSDYWDPYAVYYYPRGGYVRGRYTSPIWGCRSKYYRGSRRHHFRPSYGIRGVYHGNGWSIRIGR